MARFPPSCAQATSAVYLSKATFSVYRTIVILLSGPKHGRYGRLAEMAWAWDYRESSARLTGGDSGDSHYLFPL